jgi:hypothetical protein
MPAEEIVERHLAYMVPRVWRDDDVQRDTKRSLKLAEAIVGAKLVLPAKGFFSDMTQPNIKTDPEYHVDEDEDVSETLQSINLSEKLFGYRSNDGSVDPEKIPTRSVTDKDWWNQLDKDNGLNGMDTAKVRYTKELKEKNGWYLKHGYKDSNGEW